MCANYQWLICAARGMLHGQGSAAMRFATRPQDLNVAGEGAKPLGGRGSYSKPGCNSASQCYSSQDIFFLEVCVINSICDNGSQLFDLEIGQECAA